ncbi:protein kinase [Nocardiopsis sediminis]|uniref:non-specific serine/threonine protein kinase n=1 Tax=Nocardiopsis sediminis TaxID=1778267 RepID=A0ABV8FK10_9ACTN
MVDRTVQPGQRIGGRYEFIERIGSGGFGTVWKARDHRLQADVAVKGLSLPTSASPSEWEERLARSEREVRNAARLRDHPNIVSVHDVVVEDDIPWIVMQLVVGRSLSERLKSSGPLSVPEATDIARAMLKALHAAHGAGIVHRDIKPANVMLADNGEILLTDFGIATHEEDAKLTITGGVVGSVAYMAPERIRGDKSQAPSDLFSLGATLHETLEGTGPFARDSTPAVMHAVVYEEAPQPQRAGSLTPLITRLMAKAPEERPTVAEALALLDAPPPVAVPQRVPTGPTAAATGISAIPTPPGVMPTQTPPGVVPAPQPVPGPMPGPQTWTPPPGATPPGVTPPGAMAPGAAPGLSSKGKLLIWIAGTAVLVIVIAVFGVSLALHADQQASEEVGEGEGPGTQAALFENGSPVTIEDEATVESTIDVADVEGNAPTSLGVTVDLTHTALSDLNIQLIAPDGTAFELEPYGEPHDYTIDASSAGAAGTWTLRIEDTTAQDTGTLNSWALEFAQGGSDAVGGSAAPGDGAFENSSPVAIEDMSTAESTIEVTGVEGTAPATLGVTVDLEHTYLSDLTLQLIAPDGTSFDLEGETVNGTNEYTVDASAVEAAGVWTLRIEDQTAQDSGTLNSWSLRF